MISSSRHFSHFLSINVRNRYQFIIHRIMSEQGFQKNVPIEQKVTKLKKIDPNEMSKEQLLLRVRQLEANITNLRNVISKNTAAEDGTEKEYKHKRAFDFKQYHTRHVLLKFAYFGWDYHGYAVQEDNINTIEHELFKALDKTRLIESRQTSNYHRCGRTDKGVSAFSQVVSIDLRTNLLEGKGIKIREDCTAHERKSCDREIPYCELLNKVLPVNIRMIAWCPVEQDLSARFDCKERTYKYYFPRANLDLKLMQEAGDKLVGSHDFRNLAKMDVGNGVTTFTRHIKQVSLQTLQHSNETGYEMCELTIVGNAFVWHQIRCIVSVLFMVGLGQEQPQIIDHLLDVETNPCKPQYHMASELPLVLYDCQYEGVEWVVDEEAHKQLMRSLQHQWADAAVKATMMRKLLRDVEALPTSQQTTCNEGENLPVFHHLSHIHVDAGNRPNKGHKPLLERQTCDSLEERMRYFAKRRKLELETLSSQGDTDSDTDMSQCHQTVNTTGHKLEDTGSNPGDVASNIEQVTVTAQKIQDDCDKISEETCVMAPSGSCDTKQTSAVNSNDRKSVPQS